MRNSTAAPMHHVGVQGRPRATDTVTNLVFEVFRSETLCFDFYLFYAGCACVCVNDHASM